MAYYLQDPKKLNQLIAIAANQAGFDTQDKDPNSQYRHDILKSLTGKTSTSKMTITEKNKVLDHFKNGGFKVSAKRNTKRNPIWLRKLISLWKEMHAAGYVRTDTFAALEAWAKSTLKNTPDAPQKLDWMGEYATILIEALKQYQNRCEKDEMSRN